MSTEVTRRKNPLLAALLSFFLPGAGQLYNEDFGKFIILFTVNVAAILTIVYTGVSMGSSAIHGAMMPDPFDIVKIVASGLIFLGLWLYGIIDAVTCAQRFSSAGAVASTAISEAKKKEGAVTLGVVLLGFGLVCLLLQFGLRFESLIKFGFPLALILLGGYLMVRTSGLTKGGK